MQERPKLLRNRPGIAIPIVAVCMIMLLGFAAIAIDIGMLLDSRAEAQRAADAAALAGASALLEYRNLAPSQRQDSARMRAEQLAAQNTIRGAAVAATELSLQFLQGDARIAVTITRSGIAPLVATIFGIDALQVAATAHAMYYQGGSASCLKPFGVPDRDPFTLGSINQRILIWQKSTHDEYPLVRHLIVGNNVRDAIESLACNAAILSVGATMELQSGTAPMTGQVEQGLNTLYSADPGLSYDPDNPLTHPYQGFNRPDWRSSSRVLNLVTYDPASATQTTFVVTGFLSIFLSEPMLNGTQGDRLQYGIVLPHRPAAAGGPCTPPNCSATSWAFRLVQ